MVFAASLLPVVLAAVSLVAGHSHPAPGSVEHMRREAFQLNARRSLAGCQETLSKRNGVYERAKARREAYAKQARKAKSLRRSFLWTLMLNFLTFWVGSNVPFRRDLDSVLAEDHQSDFTGVTNETDAATLFTGNSSWRFGAGGHTRPLL